MKTKLPSFSRQNTNGIFIILSFVALLSGGLIYLLFRSTEPVFFQWIKVLNLNKWLSLQRQKSASLPLHFPEWFLYSLPNGLWAFAYALIITTIWAGNKSWLRTLWMASIPVLVFGFELLQYMHFIPGTFCLQDIAFGMAGLTIGIAVGIIICKSGKPKSISS